MHDAELADGNLFLDEVDVELDVLGMPMMNRVLQHVDGRNVVAKCHGRRRNRAVDLAEKMS